MELDYTITINSSGGYNLPLPVIRSRFGGQWTDIYGNSALFGKLLTAYILIDLMPQYSARDILGGRSHYKEVLEMLECS
jgi:hypothetical protein